MQIYEDVVYLDVADVLLLYALAVGCPPDQARDQLRSPDGLESALMRPITNRIYYDADLAFQTAVLVHGIAEGQYFIEGNKRTAGAACIAFLRKNGFHLTMPDATLAAWIAELAGDLTVDKLADLLRPHLVMGQSSTG